MEAQFLEFVRKRFHPGPHTEVGIGDDAAVLRICAGTETVVTTDLIAEGSHFLVSELSHRQIGRKALAVNLSDLAAMGATATAATVSLLLTRDSRVAQCGEEIMEGVRILADEFAVDIVGGDTNVWDGGLVVSVTALGHVPTGRAWLRSGACAGDRIIVTGTLGGSRLAHHHQFTPRLDAARLLRQNYDVHAAMDLSDGLSLDLSRMADASGVGAELDLGRIPVSNAAKELALHDALSPIDHALQDGEDFELLLAMPASSAARLLADSEFPVACADIGEFTGEPGLWSMTPAGRVRLRPKGFLHS
ncbi:MAG: thiamine-phosphate kinase [Planctomycetota bacterium]|nr:thiamine-phosphate kinase [Planctomycetota bacterium]MDA1179306.1 thiamine-phosphate kinase [Planctomycetota bacterium]